MLHVNGFDHPSHVSVSFDGTWMRRGDFPGFGDQTLITQTNASQYSREYGSHPPHMASRLGLWSISFW